MQNKLNNIIRRRKNLLPRALTKTLLKFRMQHYLCALRNTKNSTPIFSNPLQLTPQQPQNLP